jgi:gliding motility-associated-like protein
MKIFIKILFLFLSFNLAYAQSPTCQTASAMCSGQGGPYNNTNTTTPGGNQTGIGAITGCGTSNAHGNNGSLGSTPRPAWFYYTVGQSGPIILNLQQTNTNGNPIDVDFALWGPFNTTNLANICNSLSGVVGSTYTGPCNLVDASFSTSANENIHIPNGITGEVYLLLVTNFNGAAGTYTINQTNTTAPGAGQISCDRVCGIDLGPDRRFCTSSVNSLELVATFIQAPTTGGTPSYSWFFYNGTTWELRATTSTNRYTVNQNGFWRVSVTRPGCTDVTQDDIEVRFATRPAVNSPSNMNAPAGACSHTFDLTQNQAALTAPVAPSNYVIKYYTDENDCLAGNSNFIANPTNYAVTTTTTIYVRVENLGYSTCADATKFFDLVIDCITPPCQLDLTSAVATSNQTICLNSPIQNITYSFGGEATGAVVTGLPNGLTAVISSGVVTISGTPTETGVFNYSVTSVGCATNTSRQGTIRINPVPALTSVTSNTPICLGSNAVYTLQGTSGAVVSYTINGGTAQNVTIPSSGQATITVTAPTSNVNLAISSINLGTCSANLTSSSQVIVNALPNVTSITNANSPICSGTSANFTINGTANAIVTYTVNGGAPTTTTINASGIGTITVPNVTSNVSVALSQVSIGLCSSPLTLTGNVATLVSPSVSSLTSNSPICSGSNAIFTISGTANTIVSYSLNGGTSTNITLNATGTGVIPITNATANQTIQLTNVFDGTCNRSLTNSASVVVNPIPNTPTITPQSDTFCIGEELKFNVTGGANEVINYTVNNGANQTLNLNASGTGIIAINNPTTVTVAINLVNITNGLCSKSLTLSSDAEVVSCEIPKGVSPNGDGLNDTWDLRGYNVKKVEIFNRYGTKVYSKTNYIDEWHGQSDNSNELPDGTYYYVVEFNDSPVKTGWVYLNREQ